MAVRTDTGPGSGTALTGRVPSGSVSWVTRGFLGGTQFPHALPQWRLGRRRSLPTPTPGPVSGSTVTGGPQNHRRPSYTRSTAACRGRPDWESGSGWDPVTTTQGGVSTSLACPPSQSTCVEGVPGVDPVDAGSFPLRSGRTDRVASRWCPGWEWGGGAPSFSFSKCL